MVIDACYLLNELDLLEIRLNILDKYVDKFVIVEGTETFSGMEKELCFEKNKERFAKWQDKIIYHIVSDYPEDEELFEMALNSPNTNGVEPWLTEFYFKESLRKALVGLNDDDIVFVSDIDEIWNPELTYNPKDGEVLKPKQLSYLYYVNQRTDASWLEWTGTTCCRYETIKNGIINHIRTDELTPFTVLENGGWHFCSIGGKRDKMKAWKNPDYDTFLEDVWERRLKGARIDEVDLPQYLLDNKEKWKHLFK